MTILWKGYYVMEAAEAATGFEQQPMKSRLWLPALVASLLLCMEIYALFFDIGKQSTLQQSGQPLIATFQQGINEVRNRPGGTITWQVPNPGAALHEQDAILTMTRAQALVRFTDGAELNIEPDSLVVLEKSPAEEAQRYQKIVIRLIQGSLAKQTTGTLPMSVDAAGTRIEDATGEALFRLRQNGGQFDIEVESGSIRVGDANGTQTVDSSQKATIRAGKVEVRRLGVRFSELKPLSGARIGRDEDEKKIIVEWQQAVDADVTDFEPRVLVSRQPDMSNPLEAEIVDKKGSPLRAEIEVGADGPYFWRVQGKDGVLRSRTATLFSVTRISPKIEAPDEEGEALVGQPVKFRWQGVAANVTLETSRSEDFSDATRYLPRPGENSFETSFTTPEKIYWRLRADYGPGLGAARPTETRELDVKARPMLKAPGKFKSKIRKQTSLQERVLDFVTKIFWVNSAEAAETPGGAHKIAIELEWESIEGARQYRLQIAPTSDFKNVLFDRKLQTPTFEYTTEQTAVERKLFYRVASIDAVGTQGEFSDAQELEIEALPEPEAKPKPEPKPKPKPPKKTLAKVTEMAPTTPAIKPVLLTEEQRRDREHFHLSVSLGAAYHSRSFISKTKPTTSVGAGLIPAYGSLELAHKLSSAAIEADDGQGMSLALGAALLAEQAEPTTAGILVEKFSIPLLRAWVLFENNILGGFGGLGAYGTTSQKFSWNGRHAVNERVMALGVSARWATSQVLPRAWHWRIQLGLVGSGAKGADVNISLRGFFSGTVRQTDHSGLFWEAEIFDRYLDIETSYGGVVKLGYAL